MKLEERQITLDSIPGMGLTLAKAATTRKRKQLEPASSPLAIFVNGVRADASKLAKFRSVCGFSETPYLPLTYPHIMAFPLHLQMMLQPEFPFSPIGAVHIKNRIRQQRDIGIDEAMDVSVRLGETNRVAKGHEITFTTQASIEGERVWDGLSVMLVRSGDTGVKQEKRTATEAQYTDVVTWPVAANKGREYALASGDYNPIHLYSLTARAMGFKRQIMHGMWSKSRAVAHLLPADCHWPVSIEVAFKLPIFLPATVTLLSHSDATGSRFEMRDGKGEMPHLVGELRFGGSDIESRQGATLGRPRPVKRNHQSSEMQRSLRYPVHQRRRR
jgi:acyl dehydratase